MKKLIIYVSALLLTTACTSETEQDLSNEPKEIQLTAGILRTQVKAPIDQDGNGYLTKALTNVQFLQIDGESPAWENTASSFEGTIGIGEAGTINIDSEAHPHYPIDGSKTNIMGYYPAGTVTTGKISMKITGAEDVLYAPAASGSKTQDIGKMAFAHKLTQFKVVVKRAADIITDISDINVKIDTVRTTFDMAISNGTLSNWDTLSSDIQPVKNGSTANNGYTSEGFMLQPGLSTISLNISAPNFTTTSIPFKAVDENKLSGENIKFEEGKSYILTITFGAKDVTGSAIVGVWVAGNNPGEGTVTQ